MDETSVFQTAIALQQAGRLDEARQQYEAIVARNPRHFDSLCQLSLIAFHQGSVPDALRYVDLAIATNTRVAGVHNNRGTFLLYLQRYVEALAAFEDALALDARDAQAHNNRGIALQKLGRFADSLASIERALALRPDYAKAHTDRAYVLIDLKRFDDAIAACDQAIALVPHMLDAYDHKGIAYFETGRYEQAIASFDQALAIEPRYAVSHRNRASALEKLKRLDEALLAYSAALNCDETIELMAGGALHLSQQMCAWADYRKLSAHVLTGIDAGRVVSAPFPVLAIPSTPAQQRKIAELYCRYKMPAAVPAASFTPRANQGKIRIGYFSADFHDHAVGYGLVGVAECHDRTRFETYGFLIAPRQSDATQRRLRGALTQFIDVSAMSDVDAAHTAREYGIDIAVDLGGHTTDSRPEIFAQGAAPLQAGWFGYPGTTGAPSMHYLMADRTVIPPEQRAHYSEKIVALPDCYTPFDAARPISKRAFTRSELGLPETGFVFCCFNAGFKITPDVFAVWMRLLNKVEGSVLWLLARNEWAQRNLKVEALKLGIAPERLVFGTPMPNAEHLARHRCADLFLDTLDYGAHSTAIDALWAGLPVLTTPGASFASRVGASMLAAAGLPELIAADVADYESRAVALATSPTLLASLKQRLAIAHGTAPLFDTTRFTHGIEQAFTLMWERHLAGLAPTDIQVESST